MATDTSGSKMKADILAGLEFKMASNGLMPSLYEDIAKPLLNYVGRVYGFNMRKLVWSGTEAVFAKPTYPSGASPSEEEKAIWAKEYDVYMKDVRLYEEQKAKVFALVKSKCDKAMTNYVESQQSYQAADDNSDVKALLEIVKDAIHGKSSKKDPAMQGALSFKLLGKAWQQEGEDLVGYYNRFESLVENFEESYGAIVPEQVATAIGESKSVARD